MKWKFWDKPQPTPAPVLEAPTSSWAWREKPGAHERHLQRRHNNLLFPAARRVVTTADVEAARQQDGAEYKDLVDKFRAIDIPEEIPPNHDDYLDNIREQIDALKERARQIGGDTVKIKDALNDTRLNFADVWHATRKSNPKALAIYEEAEAAYHAHDQELELRGDFSNQLLRDDPSIPPGEVVPALLTENAESVAAFWQTMPDDQKTSINKWAADCIHDAMTEGFEIGHVREQLLAMGWPRVKEP